MAKALMEAFAILDSLFTNITDKEHLREQYCDRHAV
jgi:hypothetical protein